MPTVDQLRHGITTRPATVTSTVDGREHLVSEQSTVAGQASGHGVYVALCGHRVVAAALVVPPGPTCLDCETALHRIATASTRSHRRRGGLMARVLRRRGDLRSRITGSHRA